MARWRERPEPGIPVWVRVAWAVGSDGEREAANEWLEALLDRDPEAGYVALVECLSTPSYG